jgi:hypothetical protein
MAKTDPVRETQPGPGPRVDVKEKPSSPPEMAVSKEKPQPSAGRVGAEKGPQSPPGQLASAKKSGTEAKLADTSASPPTGEAKRGLYRVRKGDNLLKIAGRREVYGDPLKWPSLLRLNIEALSGMKDSEGFEENELPAGLDLRFATSDVLARNRTKVYRKPWVVHVFSTKTMEGTTPAAVTLVRRGYRVYLARATVNRQAWIRLRVGFFEGRSEAVRASKKIMSLLNGKGAWVTEIPRSELEEFGGY